MRDEFSTLDIVKALEIERERLREWMNRGFIKPTHPSAGQGTKAIFSREDVHCVQLYRQLVEIGIDRDMASKHIEYYRKHRTEENGQKCDYLIYRKGKLSSVTAFTGEGAQFDFHKGLPDSHEYFYDQYFDKEWLSIRIINIMALRKETDKALEAL